MGETAIAVRGEQGLAPDDDEFPIQRLVAQKAAIQRAMHAVMKDGEHFGIIPGTEKQDRNGRDISKPSLLQPGADTLCFLFRLRADYEPVQATEQDTWIALTVRCRLFHIETGKEWGSGMGSANSREKRYASQASAKRCPKCDKSGAIIKGKADYGGGWLCWKKKGGCDAKFPDGDKSIEEQAVVPTTSVWDLHNTLWKMACKRAKVAAILTATAASDCFTQDLEDLVEAMPEYTPPKGQSRQPAKSAAANTTGGSAPPSSNEPPTAELPEDPLLTPSEVEQVRKALDKVLPLPEPAKPKSPANVERRKERCRYVAWACGAWPDDKKGLATLTASQGFAVISKADAGEMPRPGEGRP